MATKKKEPKKAPKKPVKKPGKCKKTKKNSTKTGGKKTYIAIVLDTSSSMDSIRAETINSFNEQIDVIRKESQGMETIVSLTTFDNNVGFTFFNKPVDTLQKLTTDQYVPNGMTAMYDAIGMTIDKMHKELPDINDPEVAVLFVVITDGQENASKKFSAQTVASSVKSLTDTKRWTFSIVGANIDLVKLSDQLNIDKRNMLKISANAAGVTRGTGAMTASYGGYISTRRVGTASSFSTQGLYSSDADQVMDVSDENTGAVPLVNINISKS